MEISIQEEIDLVNEIIRTAINHGGDQGGAYYTNWDCLQTAIGEWLYARGLADSYTPSNDVDGIVPIKKVSFSDQASDGSIWSLEIPTVDSNGKQISAVEKWDEIHQNGLHTFRPGVKFELRCGSQDDPCFQYHYHAGHYSGPGIVVRILVDRADSDGACKFYQDCIDGHFFVDNIPPQYISLCRNVITDINEMLLESGYDVYEIFTGNPMIRLRNLKNNEKIDLYYDGNYRSRVALSSELIDVLVKVHDMYWAKN